MGEKKIGGGHTIISPVGEEDAVAERIAEVNAVMSGALDSPAFHVAVRGAGQWALASAAMGAFEASVLAAAVAETGRVAAVMTTNQAGEIEGAVEVYGRPSLVVQAWLECLGGCAAELADGAAHSVQMTAARIAAIPPGTETEH